ncbi:hypothetical protein GCM10027174_45950 [Salinifilum aidingensis]
MLGWNMAKRARLRRQGLVDPRPDAAQRWPEGSTRPPARCPAAPSQPVEAGGGSGGPAPPEVTGVLSGGPADRRDGGEVCRRG